MKSSKRHLIPKTVRRKRIPFSVAVRHLTKTGLERRFRLVITRPEDGRSIVGTLLIPQRPQQLKV